MRNAFLAAFAIIGLSATNAHAILVLAIDDPTTAGIDKIIVDDADGGVGTGTAYGASTDADVFVGDGTVVWAGTVGGLAVNVTTATSKPITNGNRIHLNTLAAGTGAIDLYMYDTGFLGGAPLGNLQFVIGGTLGDSAFVSVDHTLTGADNGNVGGTVTSPINPIGPWTNPGSTTILFGGSVGGAFAPSPPFSLAMKTSIVHTTNATTSFDADLALLPEPGSMALLGLGLVTLGMGRVRRRRRN